ncbi:MAG: sulfurtransferase [Ignavibacteriae bacterium]|nr:sulfurtransferase [Ignavibacteria bacterium]MBI3364115.1 sulfurtransferase [Ignavibacteriota bacterium]
MMHARILMTCVLILSVVLTLCADESAPVFVTTAWLADHLNDPDLIILNVAQNKRDYRRGHIPGTRFLWVTSFATPNPELSFELPAVEHLDTLLEGLGVSNDSRIILCGVNGNVSPTARMYITLEYLGMGDRTSILDGGFDAWKAEGRPISKDTPTFKRSSFTPHLQKDAIVDGEYVKSKLNTAGVTIVDARAPQFYNGNGGGFPRVGHIPGAKNLYFATLVDTSNKYLPDDSLRAKFSAAGIPSGNDIITYCHVGQTASTVFVAAKRLGYHVHLYDGSFEDWSGRDEFPVELPAKKDSVR